jgi:hypothetical protein
MRRLRPITISSKRDSVDYSETLRSRLLFAWYLLGKIEPAEFLKYFSFSAAGQYTQDLWKRPETIVCSRGSP